LHDSIVFLLRYIELDSEIGRAVAFSLAAFRQAFVAGRDLSEETGR